MPGIFKSATIAPGPSRISYLKLDSPVLDSIVVLALVLCVEIGESNGSPALFGGNPDLAENTGVDVAHENLSDGVEAVSWR